MNKNENKKLSLVGDLLACRVEGCKDKALTLSDYCWLHIPDKEAYKSRVLETLNKESSARRFNLKKVVLEGIELMNIDFSEADLSQGILSESNLFYNNFSKADLMGCDLSKSDLTGSVFLEADLTRCNLAGTRFWHSDFSNASLTEANLSNADLWQCKLYNSRMWRADISNAKFLTRLSFSQRKGKFITVEKINEKTYLSAEDAYRCLKRYFITQGRYDDASWASFKEKTMEKARLLKDKNIAYIPVAIMALLCGYGEKPHRVILSSAFLIFLYALLYHVFDAANFSFQTRYVLGFWDYVYYSVVTFTTLGYGDIIPKMNYAYRLLAVSEAFIGAFTMGLFVFTLARKYSAR